MIGILKERMETELSGTLKKASKLMEDSRWTEIEEPSKWI